MVNISLDVQQCRTTSFFRNAERFECKINVDNARTDPGFPALNSQDSGAASQINPPAAGPIEVHKFSDKPFDQSGVDCSMIVVRSGFEAKGARDPAFRGYQDLPGKGR
jgi:hypothetical protein